MKLPHAVVPVCGLGLGLTSLAVARGAPSESLGGESTGSSLILVAAGYSLVVSGAVARARRPLSRFGVILAAAGAAWFFGELNNPGAGSPILFTVGLLAYAACPAVVAHAAFAYPDGRTISGIERAGLLVAYVSTLVALGLLPALAFEPVAQGCAQCPHNLLAVADAPGVVATSQRVGLVLGLVWAPALAGLLLVRLAHASRAARVLTAPVVLAAVAYLALVSASYAHSVGHGFLSNDSVDQQLWRWQGLTLIALVLGLASAWARSRRARTEVARLVIDLSDATAPGGLRDALARALDDPSLELAYPLGRDRNVDAYGRPVKHPGADGRAMTSLMRAGRPVALLIHRPELLDDVGRLEDVGAAARLALDRERLGAEARAQIVQLRASRARTVAAGDGERRRLERDLHDGAQQRLVVLSFALRLLRDRLNADAVGLVDAAETEVHGALSELRELARGIYPAVLADEGLATAIEALAETGQPITIDALPDERLLPAVEAAAYFLVAEVIRRGGDDAVVVDLRHSGGRLLVEIDRAGPLDDDLIDLEDRIGALDGTLSIQRPPSGSTTVRAEIPCGS